MDFPCRPTDIHGPSALDGDPSAFVDLFENQDVGVTELECFEKDTAIGGAVVF